MPARGQGCQRRAHLPGFVAIAEPPRGAPALAARTVAAAMSWAEAFSDPPGAGCSSSASIVDCAMSLPLSLVQFAHRAPEAGASPA
jgi:hypothetical protein